MKDLTKNISLHCDVCGNDQFSTVDDSIEERCFEMSLIMVYH